MAKHIRTRKCEPNPWWRFPNWRQTLQLDCGLQFNGVTQRFAFKLFAQVCAAHTLIASHYQCTYKSTVNECMNTRIYIDTVRQSKCKKIYWQIHVCRPISKCVETIAHNAYDSIFSNIISLF